MPEAALSPGEFSLRVVTRSGPNDWLAAVVSDGQIAVTASRIRGALEFLGSSPIEEIRDLRTARDLADAIIAVPQDHILMVSGLDDLEASDWAHLDLLRSRLNRAAASILVLTGQAAARLVVNAPNLESWIGGSMWPVDLGAEELSPQEREERLQALSLRFGMSADEVIALAERNQIPSDPDFVEWLILLDRADLIGNR